jgi:type IV secretion system protein TrbE
LEHLMESGANAARKVVPVLLYIFHRIEQRLDGRPTLLILDEAWTFIDNSLFAEKIRDWLKTLRKKNASVIFATQSVSDIMGKPITAALLESCPTKILLPNPEARSQNSSAAYKQMGLSDRQIEILSYAIPKRNYYYMSPLGQRLFDMGLGPTAISFVGASGKEDIAAIRQLERDLGGDWPAEWLWRRGLNVAAAYWVGGPEEAADAYAVMEKYRQTWPAEWLQLHGHTREAQRWMDAYQQRTGTDEGRVVTDLYAAVAAGR